MIKFGDNEALRLLRELDVPVQLEAHLDHVAAAASELVRSLAEMGIPVNRDAVVGGARLHDIGKLLAPDELSGPGSSHEEIGRDLLLERGVPAGVARAAWVHGDWRERAETLEDLLVCLADKLWKGVRIQELETATVQTIASRSGLDHWDVYPWFVAACDDLALGADQRLR